MGSKFVHPQFCCAIVALVFVLASAPLQVPTQAVSVDPAKLTRIGTVDERFASYNIEMAEVTGGNFWKPYHRQNSAAAQTTQPAESAPTPAGMDPHMYQYRPPIDLSNPQLRKLASALGPVYVRVSGTWANLVYFANSDTGKGAGGFQRCVNAKRMERRDRFRACGERRTRNFIRYKHRNSQRSRGVDSKRGQRVACIHKIRWRADRSRRVHERANLRCHGRSTQILQRC